MKHLKDILNKEIHEGLKLGSSKITLNPSPETYKELRAILIERLKKDPNADLNDIDVSKVDNMTGLFAGTDINILNIKEPKLNKWDVSHVKYMNSMFAGNHNFNADLSGWDVSNVEDMAYMFKNCVSFEGKGLDKWDPGVTDVYQGYSGIFMNCVSLKNRRKIKWLDYKV